MGIWTCRINKGQKWIILNKEFGSTLCDKLSDMVWEGGKAAMGGCTGDVVMNPILCHLYWNRVQVLDELMIQDAAMISLDDVVVQGWTYDGCSLYAGLMGCLLIMYWPSFFGLEVLVQWLLSLWPCVSLTVCHPKYFLPVKTWESCFALMSNWSHRLFGHTLIEIFAVQFQPNCHC